jgi:hypothetical protein
MLHKISCCFKIAQSVKRVVTMPNTIYYWQGVLGAEENLEAYHDAIDKLLSGNYQAADLDLKKLEHHRVFSVRVNQSDRLLFTTIQVEGKPYLLLLEVILNHDYQKSRFLKPGVLRQYLEHHETELTQKIIDEKSFIATDVKPELGAENDSSDNAPSCFPVNFYDQKFIVLNSEQQGVLTAPLPVVVSGGPGSGKSCVAISLLEQCQQTQVTDEAGPILYVTQSGRLAHSMQRIWDDLPRTSDMLKSVQFKTYAQPLQEIAPQIAGLKIVGDADFQAWLKDHINAQKTLRKTAAAPLPDEDFFNQEALIYQEVRLMSGFSPDEYRLLGQKQCHFHEGIEKEWLLKAFEAYQRYLQANNLVHPAFYAVKAEAQYDCIVVDEAQDLSTNQLLTLLELATNSQTCFLMDSHQSLFDNKSQRPVLLDKLHEKNYTLSHITLPFSYRCPPNITEVANEVINLKTRLTGGLVDKFEARKIEHNQHHANAGNVRWFNQFSNEENAHFVNMATSTNVAIVTPLQFKEEARELFKTPLVFTPEEIKGLEYQTIIAYRPYDIPVYEEANKILAQTEASTSSKHRAKKGQGNDKFGPPFNKIFTAFTRAMRDLIIYQPHSHAIEEIVKSLKANMNKTPAPDLSSSSSALASSAADWHKEAARQEEMGNTEQAKAIRSEKLGETNKTQEPLKGKGKGKAKKRKNKNKAKKSATASTTALTPEAGSTSTDIQKNTQPTPIPKSLPATKTPAPTSLAKPAAVLTSTEYVEGLYQNFTEANLHKLFSSKNPARWFFDVPMHPYPSLVACLVNDEPKIQLLFSFLYAHPEYALLPSGDSLCRLPDTSFSLLFDLSSNNSGKRLLTILLHYNPLLAIEIYADDLSCYVEDPTNPYEQTSPLYWLSATQEGQKILKVLLDNNPRLATTIKGIVLCRSRPKEAGAFENTSPLYCLSGSTEGLDILKKLIDKSSIAKEITADSLCKLRNAETGVHENCSVLYLLANPQQGLAILNSLLCQNPQLANEITPQALYSLRNQKAGNEAGRSVFDLLLTSNDGRVILNKLLSASPFLANEITSDILCSLRFYFIDKQEATPPLYWLASIQEGRNILHTLLEKNPRVAEKITGEALCLPRTQFAGPNQNTSSLYWLSACDPFTLYTLLVKNPRLAQGIPSQALCLPRESTGIHQNASPLYWLTGSPKGREVLKLLLVQNPQLANGITADALCRPLTKSTNHLENSCPIGLLLTSKNGRTILTILLEHNPQLIEGITAEALCRQRNSKAQGEENTSVFYSLTVSNEGREILDLIFPPKNQIEPPRQSFSFFKTITQHLNEMRLEEEIEPEADFEMESLNQVT